MWQPLPPPGCGGEWKRNRQKLVGHDKGSLTEQQTEGTGTTTIQKKRVTQNKPAEQSPQNRTALSDCNAVVPFRATREFPPPSSPPPEPSMTAHGM